jgi:hypothetical protein
MFIRQYTTAAEKTARLLPSLSSHYINGMAIAGMMSALTGGPPPPRTPRLGPPPFVLDCRTPVLSGTRLVS